MPRCDAPGTPSRQTPLVQRSQVRALEPRGLLGISKIQGRGEGLIYNIPAPDFQMTARLARSEPVERFGHTTVSCSSVAVSNPWYTGFALNAAVVLCGPSGLLT
jgi:hypothetical protein